MISKRRSDFFYTLEDDERKCLQSIERAELKVKEGFDHKVSSPLEDQRMKDDFLPRIARQTRESN